MVLAMMASFVSQTEPGARGPGGRVGVLEGFTTQSDPLMSVLGGHNPENIIGNSGPYHLEIEHHACKTMGKSCTKTGLFALATLLNVDADARTHGQHMVLPNAPHQMRSMWTHGQNPSQRDAKVQNRHRKPLETADLLRSESLLICVMDLSSDVERTLGISEL